MRVLVSGGAGYIGSVLVRRLVEKGHKVTVLDRFFYGRESLEPFLTEQKVEILDLDIRDLDGESREIAKPDAVIHLAALSNDPSCELDARLTFDTNVSGTRHIAALAKRLGVERFIFFSSCSVYGLGKASKLTEASLLNPISAYAESKVQAEEILHSLQDRTFRPTILRLATAFGGSPRMRFDLAINAMTLSALQTQRINILGGGTQWRPFVHVGDIARLCEQLLEEPMSRIGGQTFNVGCDELNYQISDLGKLIAEKIGGIDIEYPPSDADRRNYRVSFEKLKKTLNFTPANDAAYGVKEIIEQIRAQQNGSDNGSHNGAEKFYNIQVMKSRVGTPALLGGEPTRRQFLPFALPLIGQEEEDEVVATLRSGWLTTGPRTKKFEEKLAQYVGTTDCLALSSCTAALHLALAALDIGAGHEVITPSLTFCSTVNVIEHVGATPVFVDVDPRNLNMNTDLIERLITPRTKAIVVVHLAGYPCDLSNVCALAAKYNVPVIEDAAHAIGSTYAGQKIGGISDFTCFSFYPIKNMTSIEGGAITTRDPKRMERLRSLSLHGMDRDAWKRYSANGRPHWSVEEPGFKYNMTDVQAAVGIHQLDKLDSFNEKRARLAAMYNDSFADLPGFSRPEYDLSNRTMNDHLYVVKLQLDQLKITRDQLLEALAKEGIGTGIHFTPVHMHPFYKRKYPQAEKTLPETSKLADAIFSMPLYPKMTQADTLDCIRALSKILTYYAR